MEPSAVGYALAENCNYPVEGIAPGGLKIYVGDVFPGDTKVVNIECKATDKAQYKPQSVTEKFYHDYYGLAGKVWAYSIVIYFPAGGVPFAPEP